MNNAIKDLLKQLKGEAERAASRIAELQQSNLVDRDVLDTYVERFTQAVQDEVGEQEIFNLEVQRNEALKRVEQNEEIIRILTTTSKGSKVQRLKAELVGEHFNAIKVIEDKATAIYNKLNPIRTQLIKGALELEELAEEQIRHLRQIDSIDLDRKDQERYRINEYREMDGQKLIADELGRRTVSSMLNALKFTPFKDHE